ncbi:thiol reductant ABC exporter subunit CydD [Roseibium sp. M-1]
MTKQSPKNLAVGEMEAGGTSGSASCFGQADAADSKSLRLAGLLLAASDLLWIGQAALIAWALGLLPFAGVTGPSVFPQDVVWYSAVGIVLVAVLRLYLQNRSADMARLTARAIQSRARQELLKRAVDRSPAASFPSSGAFAAHVTEQVDLLGPYYRTYEPQTMRLRLVPLGIVLATACVSWLAALILLICGPIIPLFMALIGLKAKSASAGQQAELTRLSGILLDRIRGLETLTVFGSLGRTEAQIAEAGERFRTGTMQILKIAFLSSTVLELFAALGIAFCAVYVGFSLLGEIQTGTWGAPLTFAEGLFVLLLAPEFFAPLRAFAAAYHDRAGGLAALEKLETLFATDTDDRRSLDPAPASVGSGFTLAMPPDILFRSATIHLESREVFNQLDLRIAAGETVLLEGPSGSGKTTLIDTLLGFHEPVEGAILVDGRPVHQIAQELRRQVIWLGQAPRLFHGSLRSNLKRAVDDPDTIRDEDYWTALRLAGAEELVRRLPRGLDTLLGEDGFGLSVGEVRRVALARAAMRKSAPILLADEPTASLDPETAADVIAGLKKLTQNRTSIIATHDPNLQCIAGRRIALCEEGSLRPEEVPA